MTTIDTSRNPNRWSDEALDVFWNTYVDILEYTSAGHFHHPDWNALGHPHLYVDDTKMKNNVNSTIAWNAAWIAANNVDG